jgi:hypothetical protein
LLVEVKHRASARQFVPQFDRCGSDDGVVILIPNADRGAKRRHLIETRPIVPHKGFADVLMVSRCLKQRL